MVSLPTSFSPEALAMHAQIQSSPALPRRYAMLCPRKELLCQVPGNKTSRRVTESGCPTDRLPLNRSHRCPNRPLRRLQPIVGIAVNLDRD